ncbi:MAG: nucleotidyltransferase family protein [Romboutsia sp.]
MNKEELLLIDMLDSAIKGKKKIFNIDNVDIKNVLNEAKAHDIKGLIYTAFDNSLHNNIDENLLENWKKDTFFTGLYQNKMISRLGKLLQYFKEKKIDIIVLKGLVIRNLYPVPDQRTMGDADILVKKEDLNKSINLLTELGFKVEKGKCDHHIGFSHDYYGKVELHWKVTRDRCFKGDSSFEDSFWSDVITIKVGEAEVLALSYENELTHLCLHKAVHMTSSGFGLRQLCDLTLLVENKKYEIDWVKFLEKIKSCKIEKFTAYIFEICNKLFGMEIPNIFNTKELIDETYVNEFIDNIIKNGTHGKREGVSVFATQVAFNTNKEGDDKKFMKNFLRIIFPKVENMSYKYNYAKKYKLLTPIAWVHHVFAGAFNKDYNFYEKCKFMVNTVSKSKDKYSLLAELDL